MAPAADRVAGDKHDVPVRPRQAVVARDVVVVFAREAIAGRVKTRLARELGQAAALSAYRRMLFRTLGLVLRFADSRGSTRVVVAIDDNGAPGGPLMRTCLARQVTLLPQCDGDLGVRMLHAMRDAIGDADRVLLVGCDCPALDAAHLESGFVRLLDAPAMIGPTEDGGYALVGFTREGIVHAPTLFDSIAWGSDRVARQTRAAAAAIGVRLAELETLWDVDQAVDLRRWRAMRARRAHLAQCLVVLGLTGYATRASRALAASQTTSVREMPAVGLTPFSSLAAGPLKVDSPTPAVHDPPVHGETGAAAPSPDPVPRLVRGWRIERVRGVESNRMAIVQTDVGRVLRIDSNASASALVHAVPAGLRSARTLRWRWRVDGFPSPSAFGSKQADDFAARVYVIFDYPLAKVPFGDRLAIRLARTIHGDLPAAALVYVWHPSLAAGTLAPSPYTDRVRMIVGRRSDAVGRWFDESRDLVADFRRAFGDEYGAGTAPVASIAVGADTDQSGGTLTSWFGDVALLA